MSISPISRTMKSSISSCKSFSKVAKSSISLFTDKRLILVAMAFASSDESEVDTEEKSKKSLEECLAD